jgi:hypothetical protein
MGKTLHKKIEDRSIKFFPLEKKLKMGVNLRPQNKGNYFRDSQNEKTDVENLLIDQKLCSTQIYLKEIKECDAILSKQSKRLQLLGQLLLIHKNPNMDEVEKLHLQNAIQRLLRQTDINSSLLAEKEKFIFDKTSLEIVLPSIILKESYIKVELPSKPLFAKNYSGENFSRFIFSSFSPLSKIIEKISEETNILEQFRTNLSPINKKFLWTEVYWQTLIQNRKDSKVDTPLKIRKEIVKLFGVGLDPPIL